MGGWEEGRWRRIRPLGRGSQGAVWEVEEAGSGRRLALKRYNGPPPPSVFSLLGRLIHPNLAGPLSAGQDEAGGWAVMEAVEGRTLGAALGEDPARAPERLADALRGLAWLHAQGLSHGDLRPDNLLVVRDGRLVIVDFDLSTDGPERGGTPAFLAPERRAGAPPSPGSDLWALALSFIHALRPQGPRRAPAPPPGPLGEALMEMIAEDPRARPASARDAAALLARILGRSELAAETEETALAWLRPPRLAERNALIDAIQEAGRVSPVVVLAAPPGAGASRLLAELEARGLGRRAQGRPGLGPDPASEPLLLDRGEAGGRAPVAWLRALQRHAGGHGRCVVVARPGGPLAEELGAQGARILAVPTLSEAGVGAIVAGAWPGRGDPAPLAQALYRRFGGSPGAVLAALRALWAAGEPGPGALSRQELPTPEAARALPAEGLAPDLGPWLARILPGEGPARRLCALVAVARRPLPPPLLEAAFGDASELAQARRALVRWGLVHAGGPLDAEGEATASLLRAHLGAAELRQARLALAAACEAAPPDGEGRLVADAWALRLEAGDAAAGDPVAHHAGALLERGFIEDGAALVRLLEGHPRRRLLEARLALEEGRPEDALALLGAARGDDEAILLGEILVRARGGSAALQELQARLEAEPHRRELALSLGRLYIRLGRATEGLAILTPLEAGRRDDAQGATLDMWLGRGHLHLGAFDRATLHLDRAIAQSAARGDGRLEGAALQALAQVADHQGDRPTAITLLERALRLSEAAGDPLRTLTRRSHLAALRCNDGAFSEAIQTFQEASRRALRWGHVVLAAGDLSNAADALLHLGRLDEAEAEVALALASVDGERHPLCAASALEVGARVALHQGDLDLAQARAHEAHRLAEAIGVALRAVRARWTLGEIARQRGAAAEARAHLAAAEADARRLSFPFEAAVTALTLANLTLDEADGPGARRAAQRLILGAEAAALDDEGLRDLSWRVEATRARLEGDAEARGYHARRALALLEAEIAALPPEDRGRFRDRPDREAAIIALRATSRPGDSARRLERLLELGRELGQLEEVDALLARAITLAVELCGAERGFILLRRGVGEEPDAIVARDAAGQVIPQVPLRISRTVAEGVWARGEGVCVVDALADPALGRQPSVTAEGLRSILCVPMSAGGRCLGALYLDHRLVARAFDPGDLILLQGVADRVGIALQGAQERPSGGGDADPSAAPGRASPPGITHTFGEVVGRSAAMAAVIARLPAIARCDLPALITGESGTGKEVVARSLAAEGPRRQGPFVAVNCGALPEQLMESELFGHQRGAFTGADRDSPGLVVQADGGILFLDEVGEMPPAMQVKLLRFLQEGEVRPVGGQRSRRVDVRVVAATHRDLRQLVREGQLREDLYYRLGVLEVSLPPLRERPEDIPLLCDQLLAQLSPPLALGPGALALLQDHPWPGNVRELKTVLQRARVFTQGEVLRAADLKAHLNPTPPAAARGPILSLEQAEERAIRRALEATGGNKSAAARRLGIGRRTLYDKLERWQLRT